MQECIFCKIVKGEIPANKVYEDKNVLAFLDINPRSKGHTVVIPKKHYATLIEVPKDELEGLFGVVQEIGRKIIENLDAKGFNIGSNNGQMAGQVVPHLHIHIIPRYEDEKEHYGFEAAFPVKEELKNNLADVVKKLLETGGAKEEEAPEHEEPKKEVEQKPEEKKEKWHFLED